MKRKTTAWILWGMGLIFLLLFLPARGADNIYSSVIRIHILANSDSPEDQAIKLKVRDRLLSYSEQKLSGAADREEATTIINLLMRFYDPQEGHVFVDGKDVRGYDKDELHRKFGVVFQNDVIFADTIRENISFGRETDQEKLVRAAEDAMARSFIEGYGDGYDHMAAIRGANFSGGQKQRLLIARALAADPEILILDDASSALDYRTDAELRKALRAHHAGATTVVIAQRVSSILSMDEIIVLHEGEMIGRGTHEELLVSCPEYRDICRIQLSETEVG